MHETIFYKNIIKDSEKFSIFKEGIRKKKIQEFSQETLTKLKKIYYACYSGILYLYGEETTSYTIGGKMLILSHVFKNYDYELIHGRTNSTKNINFAEYGSEGLDYNSWIEVKKGNKIWVYDVFSMLMFEKDIYYKLENPEIFGKVSKQKIESHPARSDDDFSKPSDIWLFIEKLDMIEEKSKNSPFKDILIQEITRYKNEIDYDDALLKWEQEERIIKGKNIV